ncbi:MAG TPA: hypothetical protein VL127_16940 [Bryobacteraceae bacterium]|nr:hypothetical protein [Bryobacteraceae bacterium]
MLRSLDTLIGFVTVLLVLSLPVTMLTQMTTNFLRLRSRHLREGVLDVFRQLGWRFEGDGAENLAGSVVCSKDAITREDLIETLLVLAQKNTELKDKIAALAPDFDPQMLLAHVRRATLELSVERPDLAVAVVRSAALARSPLAGLASEVFGVFDSTMDRASARFTEQSRKLVAIIGIMVAVALPLDTFDLLKRLTRSDSAREQAVVLAQTFAANQSNLDQTTADSTPRDVRLAAAKLRAAEVIVVPSSRAEWLARWQQINWAGVAVSALLLTLGGPFWFTALKDLLRLRSAAASQESQDRAQRQAALTDLPPPASGERGAL